MFSLVKNIGHTIASTPRPHVIYQFALDWDGTVDIIQKRYSEFSTLHATLCIDDSDLELPPKRLLVTTFIPSAWADDALIAERKAGLEQYLCKLLQVPQYKNNDVVKEFLAPSISAPPLHFELEDAVPSTLSKKAADELVNATKTYIAASYYPSWTADNFPPEKLDYSKFDILFFAFAIPNSSSTLTWDSPTQAMLKRLVASAKKSGKGTKIVLSVGGWSGSAYFHQIADSSANRSKFVSTLSSTVFDYGLDGIDIDWEYPNGAGAGNCLWICRCSKSPQLIKGSPSSARVRHLVFSDHLLTGIQGGSKIISAAVTDLPWLGSNGNPLTNVSAYASELTYNYDINGGWSSAPGANAPLGNRPRPAFKQWTAAQVPASKLLLGLPLYGYVLKSTKTTLSNYTLPETEEGAQAKVDVDPGVDSDKPTDSISPIRGANKRPANLTKWWGTEIAFNSLVSTGALVKKVDGTYEAAAGFKRAWDDNSDTPFLYDTAQRTVVSYDVQIPTLWQTKRPFAKSKGMGGCFTWSMDQDAIRAALGK
ncbi:glycoside hydrolase family 18 protein [Mycena galericulata]|nr:glycoside hydrolase family 18 protein [Mycena galericulata]